MSFLNPSGPNPPKHEIGPLSVKSLNVPRLLVPQRSSDHLPIRSQLLRQVRQQRATRGEDGRRRQGCEHEDAIGTELLVRWAQDGGVKRERTKAWHWRAIGVLVTL